MRIATKFYIPVALGRLISRPRLGALLDEGLTHPFTLVSAPAGFGKTMLLSTWAQSLQARDPRLCWVSLDEEAFALVQDAIALSQQSESLASLTHIANGYATLLHIALFSLGGT